MPLPLKDPNNPFFNKTIEEQATLVSNWGSSKFYPLAMFSLQKNCSKKEIKAAYYSLCLQFHPDKNLNNKLIEEAMKIINEAYAFLLFNTHESPNDEEIFEMKYNIFYQELMSHHRMDSHGWSYAPMRPEVTVSSVLNYTAQGRIEKIGLLLYKVDSTGYTQGSVLRFSYGEFIQGALTADTIEEIKKIIKLHPEVLQQNLLSYTNEYFNILHLVATSDEWELMSWLLDNGADLNKLDLNGMNAIELAISAQKDRTLEMLEAHCGRNVLESIFKNYLHQHIKAPILKTDLLSMMNRSHQIANVVQKNTRNKSVIPFIMHHLSALNNEAFVLESVQKNTNLVRYLDAFPFINDNQALILTRILVRSNGALYRFLDDKYKLDPVIMVFAFAQDRDQSAFFTFVPTFSTASNHFHDNTYFQNGAVNIYRMAAITYLWSDHKLHLADGWRHYQDNLGSMFSSPYDLFYLALASIVFASPLAVIGAFSLGYVQLHLVFTMTATLGLYAWTQQMQNDLNSFSVQVSWAFFVLSPAYSILAFSIAGVFVSPLLSINLGIIFACMLISFVHVAQTCVEIFNIKSILSEHAPLGQEMPVSITVPSENHLSYGFFGLPRKNSEDRLDYAPSDARLVI